MSMFRSTVAAVLAAAGSISSSVPVSSQAPVHTAICSTVLGLSPVASVPTTTITRRIHDPSPVVVFSTIQDTVTVTPAVSTLTATDYETTTITSTASTVTDVFSTTSTEFDTATLTVTPDDITSTAVSTVSITVTTTSTIAASDSFTPIVDTLTTAMPIYNDKRSFEPSLDNDCSPILDDYKYAQEVVCLEKIILKTTTISTVTEAPTTATAAAPSTTVTETNTITTSSVVVPDDVSTTLSYSTTSTITETSTAPAVTDTVTATTTITAAISTTSTYAACATNNIAGVPLSSDFGGLAGDYIGTLAWNNVPGYTVSVNAVSSSVEDCCISCQEDSACALSGYYEYSSSKYCYLIKTTTCSSSTTYGWAYLTSDVLTYSFQASNGNCGQWRESS
ncbi:hypothetical protein N7520_003649 [Penicillium odoratum]|uniref:uncharacterized protein n=1 Tax=Penicillium odoratum TaxID=1167516 RepID=UPI0025478906|nr:uncharacterized protein N7520_003649 [Penicillium odoratum]KAJ5769090.1 hypothetical protein N7520_003649 [Penicillium odoratum]